MNNAEIFSKMLRRHFPINKKENFFYSKLPKTFAFDHCFFSTDPNAGNFASQDIVFDSVGRDILENAFQGYNACIFAYGQTGNNYLKFSTLNVY